MPVNSQIRLNSKSYGITTRGWTDGVVERFAGRESPQGSPTQDNLITPLSVQFSPGVEGFGFERVLPSLGVGPVKGFRDSTCDTRWESSIVLPVLAENSTEPVVGQTPAVIGPRDMINFNGSLYGLFEVAQSSGSGIFVCTHNGSAWVGNKTVNKNTATLVHSGSQSTGSGTITFTIDGNLEETLTHAVDFTGDSNAVTQMTRINDAITAAEIPGISNSRSSTTITLTPDDDTWKIEVGGTDNGTTKTSQTLNIQTANSMLVYGGKLFVGYVEGGSHKVASSVDGSTWVVNTGITASLMTAQSAGDNDDTILLAEIADEIVAAVWHEANNSITFFTDAGNDGAFEKDEAVDIPSAGGPTGLVVYPGADNADKLYVGTQEGLWEVATAASTWTLTHVYPMPVHADNCRRMTTHGDGSVWIPKGVTTAQVAGMVRFFTDGNRRVFDTNAGPDQNAGLPSDLLSSIQWVLSVEGQLLVAIGGGAAGRKARILSRLDSTGAWHHITQHGTVNRRMRALGFDGTNLHFEVRTGTTTSDTLFLGSPLTSPDVGATIKREASGTIHFPVVNAGMPAIPKTWLQFTVEADDLSATNSDQHIDMTYGIDGAVRTTTSVSGDFLSGVKSLGITSTEAGVNATSIGLAVTLKRGSTNTNTPVLRTLSANYIPEVQRIRWWECEIDIGRSAFLQHSTYNRSVVRTNINTLMDAGTQVPVRFPGESADVYVTIKKPKFSVVPSSGVVRSGLDTFQRHGGFVKVRFEEAY